MNGIETHWAEVDEQGRLVLPTEAVRNFGLKPGSRIRIDANGNHLRLHRPITQLNKVYIEPTDLCNLDCIMCIRNGWAEALGRMRPETFEHILDGLSKLDQKPVVFFGGLGEPLFHPRTIDWVQQVKALGCQVELITNGTTLTPKRTHALIDAGLDTLWVSLDGASPQSYADVRLGAELPTVLENLAYFKVARGGGHFLRPELGIAFVAMQRNIGDLPEIIQIGRRYGATQFSISNVAPYTPEMQNERLYAHTISNPAFLDSIWVPHLSLPKMDMEGEAAQVFLQTLRGSCNVSFAGSNFGGANDMCNFVASGSLSIRWDGGVAPCWPLMHTHTSYLHGKERHNRQHIIGNVNECSLEDLWNNPDYVAYRDRLQNFVFAPCTFCGGCDLSEANEEDCMGNTFPTCGGCLWAQGVIQCP